MLFPPWIRRPILIGLGALTLVGGLWLARDSESVHRTLSSLPIPPLASLTLAGALLLTGFTSIVILTHARLEHRLREKDRRCRLTEERFRVFYENIPIGAYRKNARGRIVAANPALLHMLGFESVEELSAALWRPMDHDSFACWAELQKLLDQRSELRGREVIWVRKDKSLLFARENTRVVRNEEGATLSYEGTVEDVSEQKQTEEVLRSTERQLRHAQKMEAIGRLAGGVAHDFNNLLTAILGYCAVLRDSPALAPDLGEFVDEISRAGERAATLTRQLLAFSRKQVLAPQVLNLNQLVEQLSGMLQRLIGDPVQLVFEPSPAPCIVQADPSQLEQVIANLVVNSRDAIGQAGTIRITTRPANITTIAREEFGDLAPGAYVCLEVSDDGCGMPRETLAHLFEPFFTTKEQGKGTGLGLAMCHGIIKQSGGHIAVTSELGHGTSVRVYLPQSRSVESAPRAEPSLAEITGGNETILLVEDEDGVRCLARHVLQLFGYTVLEARCGEEALQLSQYHAQQIDLLVSDLNMPGIGGRELGERLQKTRPETRLLYISGYTEDPAVKSATLAGRVAFMQKPFSPAALGRKVRQVLDSQATLPGPAYCQSLTTEAAHSR